MKKENFVRLTFAALFAALVFVGTVCITVPLPFGYFNLGDGFLLIAAWVVGGAYAAVAAGAGAAIADLMLAPIYAPATVVIKVIMVVLAIVISKAIIKAAPSLSIVGYGVSAVVAELFMVAGYYVYESALYGFVPALASVTGNLLQGAAATAISVVVISILSSSGILKRLPFNKK